MKAIYEVLKEFGPHYSLYWEYLEDNALRISAEYFEGPTGLKSRYTVTYEPDSLTEGPAVTRALIRSILKRVKP